MSEPVVPELGSIRKLPTWDSLRGGGYEVPLDEAMRIIDQFRAEVAEQAATIERLTETLDEIRLNHCDKCANSEMAGAALSKQP